MSYRREVIKKLKQRLARRGHDVVDSPRDLTFRDDRIAQDSWRAANRFKQVLLEKYEGRAVEDVTGCEAKKNHFGSYLLRRESATRDLDLKLKEASAGDFLADLKLVYGIGPVTEKKLRREGYTTIAQLTDHPKWGEQASSLLGRIDFTDPNDLMNLVLKWKPVSSPQIFDISGFFAPHEFGVLDIETLGLSYQPVFLMGLGKFERDELVVYQVLLKDVGQEPAGLARFGRLIEGCRVLLTYNGKSFDIPYLNRRYRFYGLESPFSQFHYDLYHYVRSAWGDHLPNCKLETVERELLDFDRSSDIPSALVPDFYQTYREKNNPGPLVPILRHNKFDIVSLVEVFSLLRSYFDHN